ncbi:GNAT family N-acetyltransferase [Nanoarchaeota archaeon]
MSLLTLNSFPNPEKIWQALLDASETISDRLRTPANVSLATHPTDQLLDTMVDIDKVFRPELRYSKKYYAGCLQERDASVLLVTAPNPIAFAMRYHEPSFGDTYFEDELAVKEPFQGNGIGPTLMDLGLVIAKELGYQRFCLFCEEVNDQGVNLRQYYKKLGFRQSAPESTFGIPMCYDLVT